MTYGIVAAILSTQAHTLKVGMMPPEIITSLTTAGAGVPTLLLAYLLYQEKKDHKELKDQHREFVQLVLRKAGFE